MVYYYQTLEEHIEKGLKCLKEIYKNRIKSYMDNLVFNYCTNIHILDWLKLSFIFHDFGKIFYFPNISGSKVNLNFQGHEWLSTYFLDKYLNLWIEANLNNPQILEEFKKMRYIALFSVLYHHHAMFTIERANKLISNNYINLLRLYQLINNVNIFLIHCRNTIFSTPKLNNNFINFMKDLINNYTNNTTDFCRSIINYVKELNKNFWKQWLTNPIIKKISLLFLDIILYCDNKSSRFANESDNYPSNVVFFARLTTKKPEKYNKGFPEVILYWGKIYRYLK